MILVASCISLNVLGFSRFKLQFLWNTSILRHTNLWKFYDSCSLSNVLELWDQNSEFVDKSHELVPKFCTDSHRTWMEWMMMAFPWSILWNVAGLMWGNSTKTDKPQEWYRSLVSSRIGRKVGQSWRHQLCDRLIKNNTHIIEHEPCIFVVFRFIFSWSMLAYPVFQSEYLWAGQSLGLHWPWVIWKYLKYC